MLETLRDLGGLETLRDFVLLFFAHVAPDTHGNSLRLPLLLHECPVALPFFREVLLHHVCSALLFDRAAKRLDIQSLRHQFAELIVHLPDSILARDDDGRVALYNGLGQLRAVAKHAHPAPKRGVRGCPLLADAMFYELLVCLVDPRAGGHAALLARHQVVRRYGVGGLRLLALFLLVVHIQQLVLLIIRMASCIRVGDGLHHQILGSQLVHFSRRKGRSRRRRIQIRSGTRHSW
mmetsp:Transcript_27991/g.70846  ORF Transcript_27991/g.70846 Transcript_27991/m.70846 type:complete len:235 (-) Transcript_27991:284-988(-)